MSHQAVDYVLAQEIKSSPQKLLMVAIAYHVDIETGKWTLKQKSLMKRATMSERQVRLHTKALEDDKRVIRHERRNPDGSQAAYEYEIVGYAEWMKDRDEAAVSIFEAEREKLQAADFRRRSTGGGNQPHPGAEINPTPGAEIRRHKSNSPSSESPYSADDIVDERQTDIEDVINDGGLPHNRATGPSPTPDTAFDAFWAIYPNFPASAGRGSRRSPSEAKKIWLRQTKKAKLEIMERVQVYASILRQNQDRPVMGAARFISGAHDEFAPSEQTFTQQASATNEEMVQAEEWSDYLRKKIWQPFYVIARRFSGPDGVPQKIRDLGERFALQQGEPA